MVVLVHSPFRSVVPGDLAETFAIDPRSHSEPPGPSAPIFVVTPWQRKKRNVGISTHGYTQPHVTRIFLLFQDPLPCGVRIVGKCGIKCSPVKSTFYVILFSPVFLRGSSRNDTVYNLSLLSYLLMAEFQLFMYEKVSIEL